MSKPRKNTIHMKVYFTAVCNNKKFQITELVRWGNLNKLWYTWEYYVANENIIIIRNTSMKHKHYTLCPHFPTLGSVNSIHTEIQVKASRTLSSGDSGSNCFQTFASCWQNSLFAVVGLRVPTSFWLLTAVYCQFLEVSPRPFHVASSISAMENFPSVVFLSHF